ncbi:MAG: AraC family transcriptional regulator [Spirochaetaceae bacterium]|jgi:YesN/AraC family two-component response regulator|nr:AraC family transcriptional regulator [Spirochaetaceae bacterium]
MKELENTKMQVLHDFTSVTGCYTAFTNKENQITNAFWPEMAAGNSPCIACLKYKDKHLGCRAMHIREIEYSRSRQTTAVYNCPIGIIFMAAAFFEKPYNMAGALLAAGYDVSKRDVYAKLLLLCAEYISVKAGVNIYKLNSMNARRALINEEIEALKKKFPKCWTCDGSRCGHKPIPEEIARREESFLNSIGKNNKETVEEQTVSLLAAYHFASHGNYEETKIHLIVFCSILSQEHSVSSSTLFGEIRKANNFNELIYNFFTLIQAIVDENAKFDNLPHAYLLKNANQYILQHITERLRLPIVAEKIGLSSPYFCTIFKDEMKTSFTDYVNKLRIENACRLLAKKGMTLLEIAQECGYNEHSTFTKTFKKYMGIGPLQYRKDLWG